MKALAAVLICDLAVLACAAPVPPATPARLLAPSAEPSQAVPSEPASGPPQPVSPPSPAPSASPSFAVTCLGAAQPGAASPGPTIEADCSDVASAVLNAVSSFGYPARAVTVRIVDFSCGGPFATGIYFCPMIPAGPGLTPGSAYVTFAGTDRVAVLSFHGADAPPIVPTIVAFEVPPVGWVMP